MKSRFYFVLLFVIYSCINEPHEHKRPKSAEAHNVINIFKGIVDKYDEAKWILYCYECDVKCNLKSGARSELTYGMLDLKLDSLVVNDNSLEFWMSFFLSSNRVNSMSAQSNPWVGVQYKLKQANPIVLADTPSALLGTGVARYAYEWGKRSRFQHPPQPEVVNYIKREPEINSLFYHEAMRRGLMR